MEAIGKGKTTFCFKGGIMVTVQEDLQIPDLDRRLLSVPQITQHGLHMQFGAKYCGIYKGNDLVVFAKRERNVYPL